MATARLAGSAGVAVNPVTPSMTCSANLASGGGHNGGGAGCVGFQGNPAERLGSGRDHNRLQRRVPEQRADAGIESSQQRGV